MQRETVPNSPDRLARLQRQLRISEALSLICLLGLMFQYWALRRPNAVD